MSPGAAHIDRLVAAVAAAKQIDITRDPDGVYLFGSNLDDDLILGVGPGADDTQVVLQTVVDNLPDDRATRAMRGLLLFNTQLIGAGLPVLGLHGDRNTMLCMQSFSRLNDQGNERDADWFALICETFLNQTRRVRALVREGLSGLPVETDVTAETDTETSDDIWLRL